MGALLAPEIEHDQTKLVLSKESLLIHFNSEISVHSQMCANPNLVISQDIYLAIWPEGISQALIPAGKFR